MDIIQKTSTHNTSLSRNRAINQIVLHYTAGTSSSKGAAANTARYFANTTVQASADFIVDDETIVQYNGDIKNRYTWAVGGKKQKANTSLSGKYHGVCTNKNSISIEMCSRKKNTKSLSVTDDDWYLTDATINNAVELTRYLMVTYSISLDHVIMHHEVTGKWCPQPWCKNEVALSNWYNFLNRVNTGNAAQPEVQQEPAQKPVTISGQKCEQYAVKVTANSLNVRSGPGTMYSKVSVLNKNATCIIKAEENGWGLLANGLGWISLAYTQKATVAVANASYIVKITAGSLNVRSGPGTNYSITSVVKKNEKYTIVEEKNGWGKLKSGVGWISLAYTQKV